MAAALKVYNKQTEDADPGASRAPYRLFAGYGLAGLLYQLPMAPSEPLAGIPLEFAQFELYYILLETAARSNSAVLAEPSSAFFPEMPVNVVSILVSPIRDESVNSYTEGHESVKWYGGEEIVDVVWPTKSIVLGRLPIEIEQRLRVLTSLPTNWDSYGALPVSRAALEKTKELLFHLYSLDIRHLPPPFIAPDPEGGLGLEWDVGPRGEVYLEISSKGQMTYVLTMGQGGHEQERTLADDLHGIEQIFKIMQPYR